MSRAIILSSAELSSKIVRAGLFSIAARSYHSEKGFYLSAKFKFREEVSKAVDPIAQEFYEHRALKHPLFPYLAEQSKVGFTKKQFLIYRDNFFRRTQLTIPSISATLGAAITYEDFDAATLALRNLRDEMGNGDIKNIHSRLLLESHNIQGMRVFRLDPLAGISEAEKSKVLVPEVEEYRIAKKEIFTRPYPFVAGNTWAHELAADSMLDNFREAFFVPYLGFYTQEEAKDVMRFFTAHKDESREDGDVEKQHERMAREAAELVCYESLEKISEVREGGLIFLTHQEKLWDGMLRELEKAQNIGEPIKPKPRIVEDAKKTNPVISKAVAEKVANQTVGKLIS